MIHPRAGSTAGPGKPQHVRDELGPSEDCFPTNLHSVFVSVQAKPQRVNIVRTLRLVQTRPKKKRFIISVSDENKQQRLFSPLRAFISE